LAGCAGIAVTEKTRNTDHKFDYMKPNPSSDLRLLHQLRRKIRHSTESIENLFEPLPQLANSTIGRREDAIPPQPASGGKIINNITDAYNHLLRLITIPTPTHHPSKRADIIVHGLTQAFQVIESMDETSNSESSESEPTSSEPEEMTSNSNSSNEWNRSRSSNSGSNNKSKNEWNRSRSSNNE